MQKNFLFHICLHFRIYSFFQCLEILHVCKLHAVTPQATLKCIEKIRDTTYREMESGKGKSTLPNISNTTLTKCILMHDETFPLALPPSENLNFLRNLSGLNAAYSLQMLYLQFSLNILEYFCAAHSPCVQSNECTRTRLYSDIVWSGPLHAETLTYRRAPKAETPFSACVENI